MLKTIYYIGQPWANDNTPSSLALVSLTIKVQNFSPSFLSVCRRYKPRYISIDNYMKGIGKTYYRRKNVNKLAYSVNPERSICVRFMVVNTHVHRQNIKGPPSCHCPIIPTISIGNRHTRCPATGAQVGLACSYRAPYLSFPFKKQHILGPKYIAIFCTSSFESESSQRI